jgi:hypothetical protein
LVLQPEFVIFMADGRLAVGSGRRERGLAACGAATTSAAEQPAQRDDRVSEGEERVDPGFS